MKRLVTPALFRSLYRQLVRRLPFLAMWRERQRAFLARRPHRSFRLTRRRDYARSLRLPGYWSFTAYVWQTLWQSRKLFGWLLVIYTVLTVLLVGMTSQDLYGSASSAIREASQTIWSGQGWGAAQQAGLVLISAATGAFNTNTDPARTVYATILVLMTWLTTVWLLRALLAGKRPRLRDGLYNAGAPLLPTFLLTLVLILQLLPLALVAFAYGAAVASGVLAGGVEAMLFWTVAALLTILSLYWATSTFIAMIIITLPGMYPFRALTTAGDVVVGRRVRILLRLLWILLMLAVVWLIILIPLVVFDSWLKAVAPATAWVPLVPVVLLLLGSLSVVILAAYVYLLYRKVVDDDAAPAAN